MKKIGLLQLVFLLIFVGFSPLSYGYTVSDFNKMHQYEVGEIYIPNSIDELQKFIQSKKGPFSIKGGGFSMGGQTVVENGFVLDLKNLNAIRSLDITSPFPTITVEAGASWKTIQEFIDKYDLSVKVMQSYNDFTVGGSLSVNVHGRYVGYGPIISTVKAIKLVLSDGRLITANRNENSQLFAAAIGGLGGVGVIVEATLELAKNEKLERKGIIFHDQDTSKLIDRYLGHVYKDILLDNEAVMTNADLYPPSCDQIASITYYKTNKALTVQERLQTTSTYNPIPKLVQSMIQTANWAKVYREHFFDPKILSKKKIVMRNWEASYAVDELSSMKDSLPQFLNILPNSYRQALLQEYFIPKEHLKTFVPKMCAIFEKYKVNVVNISIRHVPANKESLLSWSNEESFALVIYFIQNYGKNKQGKLHIAKTWTRELIDEAINLNGSYYLPYQIFADKKQFYAVYKNACTFFKIKKEFDPNFKFQNTFWNTYYDPSQCSN